MKMTMHIDEEVLDRVMKITGAKTKREAVEIALNDMARRHKMKELFKAGLVGITPEQLKTDFAPTAADYLDSHGLPLPPLPAVAGNQAPYGQPRTPGQ